MMVVGAHKVASTEALPELGGLLSSESSCPKCNRRACWEACRHLNEHLLNYYNTENYGTSKNHLDLTTSLLNIQDDFLQEICSFQFDPCVLGAMRGFPCVQCAPTCEPAPQVVFSSEQADGNSLSYQLGIIDTITGQTNVLYSDQIALDPAQVKSFNSLGYDNGVIRGIRKNFINQIVSSFSYEISTQTYTEYPAPVLPGYTNTVHGDVKGDTLYVFNIVDGGPDSGRMYSIDQATNTVTVEPFSLTGAIGSGDAVFSGDDLYYITADELYIVTNVLTSPVTTLINTLPITSFGSLSVTDTQIIAGTSNEIYYIDRFTGVVQSNQSVTFEQTTTNPPTFNSLTDFGTSVLSCASTLIPFDCNYNLIDIPTGAAKEIDFTSSPDLFALYQNIILYITGSYESTVSGNEQYGQLIFNDIGAEIVNYENDIMHLKLSRNLTPAETLAWGYIKKTFPVPLGTEIKLLN